MTEPRTERVAYRFKTRPMPHQLAGAKFLLRNGGGALLWEMRTGKTKSAVDYANAVAIRDNAPSVPRCRALVLCPLSVIGVWEEEIALHDPLADNDLIGVDWRLVNYDRFWRPHTYDELADWLDTPMPTVMICDESQRIKNPGAKRTRFAHGLGKRAQYRVILTGTVQPRNPLDLFSQFKFLDEGIFGTNFAHFRRRYAICNGPIVLRYRNLDELYEKIAPHSMQVRRSEVFKDAPEPQHETVPVELGEARETYEQLARDSVAYLEGGKVTTPNVLARLLRLSQVTGGWLRPEEGGAYERVGSEKLTVCKDLLSDMQDNGVDKVVIFCRFLCELKAVALMARSLGYCVLAFHGGVAREKRKRMLAAFKSPNSDPTVFVAQTATGSVGISLAAADFGIFYSHSYDWGEFVQACDRLWPNAFFYHLVARNTVDQAVLTALRNKRELADLVLRRKELLGV